ncbi:MAG TPA: glutamine synthetase [Parachlamydiales bacterium]|nr:glutamine synthetase [Parachlamydiales bacterium]
MNARADVIRKMGRRSILDRPQEKEGKDEFASYVFDQKMMEERLSAEVYAHWLQVMKGQEVFNAAHADAIAKALKKWAVQKGATHYTHWFQPLTLGAAEKHDSLLTWDEVGQAIENFSGKELRQGEPDASSLPSGGLRSTHEARGYTMWDPMSFPFLWSRADGLTLCLPSLFFSWKGEALDHKIPLIRSEEAIGIAGLRLLRFCGIEAKSVFSTLGAEQEYFAIDRRLALLRPDLLLTGRTVLGAKPPKGQELKDHYFSSLQPRILAFMIDCEEEAFRLGIPLKTRHNEVAPSQHEVAPLFEKGPAAVDHNVLLMEIMRQKALEHDLVCLFHEKPFAGINGSGKHNNWSLATDTGLNLLDPKGDPLVFFTLLAAILRAVHLHAPLLRACIASAGNDLRLGGAEAPPTIPSVDVGKSLEKILRELIHKNGTDPRKIDLGLSHLPEHGADASDRNRTSFFAFTGNKFEFRGVGASASCAWPMTVLNTIVAESLHALLDSMEKEVEGEKWQGAAPLLQKAFQSSESILFSGDGYSSEWRGEAQKRGLPDVSDSHHAYAALLEKSTFHVFEGVLTEKELRSRYDIFVEHYAKTIEVEANVMIDLFRTQILPACLKAQKEWGKSLKVLADLQMPLPPRLKDGLEILTGLISDAIAAIDEVERKGEQTKDLGWDAKAKVFAELTRPKIQTARHLIDQLEKIVDDALWPLPKYWELLYLK